MTLTDWLDHGWLISYEPESEDIGRMLESAERDLKDCLTPGLSVDWRFNIAYNAIFSLGAAALSASGYRAARDSHQYWVLNSMEHTMGLDKSLVDRLDSYRKKRNLTTYENVGMISDVEAAEIVEVAGELWEQTVQWLKESHPEKLEQVSN